MDVYAIILVISGLAVRFIGISQSLWLDEATTAKVVSSFSYRTIVTSFSPADFHPPLYYLFMKAWTSIFGISELSLRMPSVLASLVAAYYVYLIGTRLMSRRSGLWSAALFLFNPLIVYYSQEARMYMIVTALLSASLYYYILLFGHRRKRDIIMLNLLLGVSFMVFYGSVFFILALFAYLLKRRKHKDALYMLPGFLCAAAILSPLTLTQFAHAKDALQLAPNWKSALGAVNVKNVLLIPLKFTVGRIQFEPKKIYYLVGGFAAMIVVIGGILGARREKALGWVFLLTLLFGVIFSFFTPLLQYFRFLYLIPLLCVLLVAGARTGIARVTVLTIFCVCTAVYLIVPAYHREDWKGVSSTIPHRAAVYMIPFSSDPLLYYRPDITIRDIRQPPRERSIVVIPYTSEIYGLHYADMLTARGYRQIKAVSSCGVTVEFYKK